MIKVKELIKMLKKEDPESIIIMSKDSEGNRYSPFSDFTIADYIPYNTWSGDIYMRKLTKEDIERGYTEEDLGPDDPERVKALVFYPVN